MLCCTWLVASVTFFLSAPGWLLVPIRREDHDNDRKQVEGLKSKKKSATFLLNLLLFYTRMLWQGAVYISEGKGLWSIVAVIRRRTAVALASFTKYELKQEEAVVSRVAFGSCANQSAPQPIWTAISAFDPQVFIWLGDNIYADAKLPVRFIGRKRTSGPFKNTPRFWPVSAEEMQKKYMMAKSISGYSALRKTTQIIGTWDDHDYGMNDAGKELSSKDVSQQLMLDFLDEPKDSPRRKQKGVYASYTYGPIGKRIKVILLDTRYHRDAIFSNGAMLGETQWAWLERELKKGDAQLNIIASSIQVISNMSAVVRPFFHVESWSNFPAEQERLYKLIADYNVSGVIFISGDVHFCEITRFECAPVEYPLFDLTSSGLTQAVEELTNPVIASVLRFAAWFVPNTMRVYNSHCRYKSCVYGKRNFGTLEIDWDADPVMIAMSVRDIFGSRVSSVEVPLSMLQPGALKREPLKRGEVRRHCTLDADLPWTRKYLLAYSFFGLCLVMTASPCLISYMAFNKLRVRRRRGQNQKAD
ncbi:hypothetical protein R1flu_028042 [Riccia fluitans]|uniref:PhoD-like phosphatase metallophosphatase domain-containing protein n=1 Tax=Riccia fluitans TaxID=41844 RepID=A0ABD1XKJ7_9MARC